MTPGNIPASVKPSMKRTAYKPPRFETAAVQAVTMPLDNETVTSVIFLL
jgi:hypothetical protein